MAFVPLSLFISDGSKSSIAFVSTKLSRILSSTTPWTCAGWEEYDDDDTAQTTESCSKHIFETALHLAHALRSTNCPLLHLSTSKVWKVVSFGLVIIGEEYCQFFGLIIIRRRERTCMTGIWNSRRRFFLPLHLSHSQLFESVHRITRPNFVSGLVKKNLQA